MNHTTNSHGGSRIYWGICFFLIVVTNFILLGCGGGGTVNSNTGSSEIPCTETIRTTQNTMSADVVVYAATPSGIAATIQASRQGKSVILLEPTSHIGGMSASGISIADVFKLDAIGGLAAQYFATVNSMYGTGYQNALSGRAYEPHIAEQAFHQMLPTCNVRVVTAAELTTINKLRTEILSITTNNNINYVGKIFIDASYEGDLMAAAGIEYTVGRESNTQYNETKNGVGKTERMIGQAVDPYVVPGKKSSGLIRNVQNKTLPAPGSADRSVMAYNFRLCITKNPENRIPFTKPIDYDPSEFEILARLSELLVKNRKDHHPPFDYYLTLVNLPNGKYDLNTGGTPSTDYVGMSELYPSASPTLRRSIAAEHKRYTQALLYFLQSSDRIPDYIKTEVSSYGLCRDEFTDNAGWPYQLYLREGRRMVGDYVVTEHDVEGQINVPDSIGLGSFYYDSHIYNRVVQSSDFIVVTERNDNGNVLPYPISYRALTPKATQASNLLVSVCMSASHIAFTSIRVEPTYMIMGQAAGTAAAIAIDQKVSVQQVPYEMLSLQLRKDGQILSYPR